MNKLLNKIKHKIVIKLQVNNYLNIIKLYLYKINLKYIKRI